MTTRKGGRPATAPNEGAKGSTSTRKKAANGAGSVERRGKGLGDNRLICQECGQKLPAGQPTEAATWRAEDDDPPANVTRHFSAVCTRDGSLVSVTKWGNHSTAMEKELKAMFPKATRKTIKARLPMRDRKAFDLMIHGKRAPDRAFLERCRALLKGC